jgi:outer membrane protein OmpA-like peptidoglycan-associated protein
MFLASGLTLPTYTTVAFAAEQRSAEDIIMALKPRIMRSLTTSPGSAPRTAEEVRTLPQWKPKIDLEIKFEFNSAGIGSKAMQQVTELGKALTSADLKGRRFVLAGHTDARGNETYNQGLSERRADAVKRFLMENYGIEARDLLTVGYGQKQLKNSENPFAGENRRVQVVNADDR